MYKDEHLDAESVDVLVHENILKREEREKDASKERSKHTHIHRELLRAVASSSVTFVNSRVF